MAPEQPHVRLGFIPLLDCAPLAAAQELGLFTAEGLQVGLSREPSWANIRDKIQAGLLDAAHMLGPMTLASTLGAGGERVAMTAPLSLNSGGSAITVSMQVATLIAEAAPEGLAHGAGAAAGLRTVIETRRARGGEPLVFAAVFPFSMHAYELRSWLAQAGIDPDHDVRLVFTPPPRMAARLRSGEIDGFCVGAPWGELSSAEGSGVILLRSGEFWAGGPDKVLGVLSAWAETRPATLQALLRALIRAQSWCDAPENREDLAKLLARPDYVDAPLVVVRESLASGDLTFQGAGAGAPQPGHAEWFLRQMLRWRQIGPDVDIPGVASEVYRPDLYRIAAEATGAPIALAEPGAEGPG